MSENSFDFGKRLKQIRKEMGYTQEDMKDMLGLNSRQAYSRYETGSDVPRMEMVKRIASALEIDWLELFPEETKNNLIRNFETVHKALIDYLYSIGIDVVYQEGNTSENYIIIYDDVPAGKTYRKYVTEIDFRKLHYKIDDMVKLEISHMDSAKTETHQLFNFNNRLDGKEGE